MWLDLRDARFRGELVGDGPAWGAAGVAETLLGGMGVNFENDAVDLVAERSALRLGQIDEAGHFFDRSNELAMRIDAEAKGRQRIECGALALRPVLALGQQEVCKEDEPAIGNDTGFKCAQRAGRGVARIHGGGQSLLLALLVQALECSFGHDYLAADFESLREADLPKCFGRNSERHAADGSHIRGDIFANLAVAAGDSADEAGAVFSRFIVQGNAEAVELEFGHVFNREQAGELAHAAIPVGQLFGGVGVVKAEHGAGVAHLLEAFGGLAAYALGGRVRREHLGMRGFDALELVHKRVVRGVRDLRRVEDVVEVLVTVEFGAQFLSALSRGRVWVGGVAHGVNYRVTRAR